MKRFLLLCAVVFSFSAIHAQQLPLFTQYRENVSVINPAAVSYSYLLYEHNVSFGLSGRVQWEGLDSAPRTQTIRGEYMSTDYSPVNLILGGHIINDQTGPTGFTGVYGRIAGLLSDEPYDYGFVLGFSAGAVQYRVKASELILRDPGDIVTAENQQSIRPDIGAGIFAYKRLFGRAWDEDVIYAGVSVPQSLGMEVEFEDVDDSFFMDRVPHFYGLVGMIKNTGKTSFIEPSAWIKYTEGAPVHVDANLRYQVSYHFWVGAGYSSANTIHLETGVLLGDDRGYGGNFRIGYGFDHAFTSFGPFVGTTHEINLAYSIGN